MTDQKPIERRTSRGALERRGRGWFNRFRFELVDPASGKVVGRGQRRMSLGRCRTEAEAGKVLARYLALQGAEALEPGIEVTAREYLTRFLRLRVPLMRWSSRRTYTSIISVHLEPHLGDLRLAEVDKGRVQELVTILHARGLTPSTISTVVARLRQILRAARSEGFSAHLITRGEIQFPSEQRAAKHQRHISPEELAQMLKATEGRSRVLWAVLGFAGLRIGEALALEWRHIDLRAGWIQVRQATIGGEIGPTKTRTACRDVPILPQLLEVLEAYRAECGPEPQGLLFRTRSGRPLRSDDVRRRRLQPLLKRLGLPPAGCHAFRHGLPGRLDALGLSPASIQRFMGHATLAMTEKYLHTAAADLREQLDAALRRNAETAP